MPSEFEIKKSVLAEIDVFSQNANRLPEKKYNKILNKVQAVWVLSGSGSYFKPGTDKARLDYAERWFLSYKKIFPQTPPPILIYNGVARQVEDLFRAIKEKKYIIPSNQIYIAPGCNIRTQDQVKNFSFPPRLNLKDGYLGIISHPAHLARIFRFMGKNRAIFQDIKVLALPCAPENPDDQIKMIEPEVKGILDYIQKGEATLDPYPYKLLGDNK